MESGDGTDDDGKDGVDNDDDDDDADGGIIQGENNDRGPMVNQASEDRDMMDASCKVMSNGRSRVVQ